MELAILIVVVIDLIFSLYHRSQILTGVQYNSDTITRIETKLDRLLKDKEGDDES